MEPNRTHVIRFLWINFLFCFFLFFLLRRAARTASRNSIRDLTATTTTATASRPILQLQSDGHLLFMHLKLVAHAKQPLNNGDRDGVR